MPESRCARLFGTAGYLPAEGYLQYAIEDSPVRLVALDTLVSGEHSGMLCDERLGWLDTALAAQLVQRAFKMNGGFEQLPNHIKGIGEPCCTPDLFRLLAEKTGSCRRIIVH